MSIAWMWSEPVRLAHLPLSSSYSHTRQALHLLLLVLVPSRSMLVGRSLTALEGHGCGRQGRDDPVASHLLRVGLDSADESKAGTHQRRALGQDMVRRIRRLLAQGAAGTPADQVVAL